MCIMLYIACDDYGNLYIPHTTYSIAVTFESLDSNNTKHSPAVPLDQVCFVHLSKLP